MLWISWIGRKGLHNIVGDENSVMEVANMLENSKVKFMIGNVGQPHIPKENQNLLFGVGGFQYWSNDLKTDEPAEMLDDKKLDSLMDSLLKGIQSRENFIWRNTRDSR